MLRQVAVVWLTVLFVWNVQNISATRYRPNWESLDQRPLPEWYDEAKIGILIHWGIYSVPSIGNEWFWHDWVNEKSSAIVNFMQRNYKPDFSYQEFANEFTAELFNATQWTKLFRDSGARYVVLTSKHHDGYTLWPSKESFGWNAMDVGPKRDLVGELSTAIRSQSKLKFGIYYSLYEWFNRMYLEDKEHNFAKQTYVEKKMLPELEHLVKEYLPDIIWANGDWEAPAAYWKSEEFLSWLYNDSPVRDTVVTNDHWGKGTGCKHGGFYGCGGRFDTGGLLPHKWVNPLTLEKNSWGHRFDSTLTDYMSSEELIQTIATTVSNNGNVLINIGPTKYGTISPIIEERLRDMGQWLDTNGEAIYASKPWIHQSRNGVFGVRYTVKTDDPQNIFLYAIVLEYPYDNELDLVKLINTQWIGLDLEINITSPTSVTLLGMEDTHIEWKVPDTSLRVVFPPKQEIDKMGLKFAWTFKITFPKSRNELFK